MLKPNIEGWSLVMVGHWNRMIFTPGWIVGRLTQAPEVGIEVPVDNPSLPIRFTFDGISLQVRSRRIEIHVERAEDSLLEKAKEVAIRILADLPHTPLSAVGFNFHFLADKPEGPLLGIFNLADVNNLSDANIKILATSIQRKLVIDGQIVNLTGSFQEDGRLLVAFNFHSDAKDTKQAIEFLKAHTIDLRQKAFEILKKVYDVTPEVEGA
jgi:hypothetical protein